MQKSSIDRHLDTTEEVKETKLETIQPTFEEIVSLSHFFELHHISITSVSEFQPLKPEFSGPKEKIVPIPDGSSFFILGKKNW